MEILHESEQFKSFYNRMFNYSSDKVYKEINFLEKFTALSNQFQKNDNRFVIESDKILAISKDLGYELKYSNAKKYYLHQHIGNLICTPAFDIMYQNIELAANFKFAKNKNFISGGPWGHICDMLSNYRIKLLDPKCNSYEDIRIILEIYYKIYEELKVGMIELFKEFTP